MINAITDKHGETAINHDYFMLYLPARQACQSFPSSLQPPSFSLCKCVCARVSVRHACGGGRACVCLWFCALPPFVENRKIKMRLTLKNIRTRESNPHASRRQPTRHNLLCFSHNRISTAGVALVTTLLVCNQERTYLAGQPP